MKDSYFMKVYKKRWKQRLIASGIILLALLASLIFGFIQYYQYENNPVIINTDEDYQKAISNESFVEINISKVYDLGLVITEKRTKYGINISEKTKSNIVAVMIGKKILPIAVSSDEYNSLINDNGTSFTFKGKLIKIDNNDLPTFTQALIRGGIPASQVDKVAYTSYLQPNTPLIAASIYFILPCILTIILLIFFVPLTLRNRKALKSLGKYTNGNIEIVCSEIDDEINKDYVYKNGVLTLTDKYIIVDSFPVVFALPVSELVWVYKKVVKQKLYGGVTTAKTESLIFVFSDKSSFNIRAKNVDNATQFISETYKTVIVGYTFELNKLYKKNFRALMTYWREQKSNAVG
ncbi:MAG: hypothetical protein AB6733_17935 [Clostridiaceae bacterium]